jgi:hypothetical protein
MRFVVKIVFSMLIVSFLVFWGCQNKSDYSIRQKRVPSSIVSGQQLRDFLSDMSVRVEEGTDDPNYCSAELNKAYETLLHMNAESSGIMNLSTSDWESLVNLSFHTRLEIKEQLKRFNLDTTEQKNCLQSIKSIVRAMRYMEDYLVEMIYTNRTNKGDELKAKSFDSLQGQGPHFLINPKFARDFKSFIDLKSGDLIISRGGAYSSAAIARIGKNDTQFSHLSLVHRGESGKLSIVESLIEVGALSYDFEKFLDYRHSLLVVFRHSDPKLAQKAADYMFERVNQALDSGIAIPYDFKMDYKKHDELFCSEVAYEAYHVASNGKVEIPTYKTAFSSENLPFLQMSGLDLDHQNIDAFRTFAPGDIQFDSEFEVVAEFRNPAKLEDSRVKDAILTKIFEWMHKYNYRFDPSLKINTITYSSWLFRRTPIVKKLLEDKFPLNMGVSQLQVFLMLDKVGEVLQARVEEIQSNADIALTPIQIYGILDEYRREDEKRYQIYKERSEDLRKLRAHAQKTRNSSLHEEMNLRREIKLNRPHFHKDYRSIKE